MLLQFFMLLLGTHRPISQDEYGGIYAIEKSSTSIRKGAHRLWITRRTIIRALISARRPGEVQLLTAASEKRAYW